MCYSFSHPLTNRSQEMAKQAPPLTEPTAPRRRGGVRQGSGRKSVSNDAGESAVLRARVGQQRIDKLARIAAAKATTSGDMLRAWIDRMKDVGAKS